MFARGAEKYNNSRNGSRHGYLTTGVAILASTLAGQASGATDVLQFRGETAFADFFKEDGCLATTVLIFAFDAREQRPPGAGETSSGAFVGILQSDTCASEDTIFAFGEASLNEDDFTIRRDLTSATLAVEIELFDFVTLAPLVVNVEADWTSTGRLEHSNFHSHSTSPGLVINSHIAGRSRPAEASATVSDGTTEFTPDPATAAGIGSDNAGEVTITF